MSLLRNVVCALTVVFAFLTSLPRVSAQSRLPEVSERLASAGVDPMITTPEEFAAYIESETARYAKFVKASGARVD